MACHQRTTTGLCEHCDFDGTDQIAVAAWARYRLGPSRWQDVRTRIALSRRRAEVTDREQRQVPVFMTCPSCRQWSVAPVCEWCDFDTTDQTSQAHLIEQERFAERRWAIRRARLYATSRGLLRIDHAEQARLVWHLVRFIVLGSIVGVLAGLSSAAFLESLRWATDLREQDPWLLWLLPVAGFVVGLVYHHGAGRAAQGNNLIIDEIHEPRAWIPRRMAPLIYVATVVTHIFGGSAGREGTAIQMSGSLTDGLFGHIARITGTDRRLLLVAAIAGGFGAVFGVPFAGCVFALEVQAAGRIRHDAIVPSLSASVVGDLVVRGLGVQHTPMPVIGSVDLTVSLVLKILVAGFAFGATALVFSELTHGLKRAFQVGVRWPPLRPFVGGVLIVALTYAVGTRDYLGLSLPLITKSLAGGAGVVAAAFAFKLLFTSLTLGSGFQGGEVTPLFVIGATLGAAVGHGLGAPVPLFAAMGFVAVFAGASNTPIACTIMGVELFGAGALVPMAMACVAAYTLSANRGIYGAQRVDRPDDERRDGDAITLQSLARQRPMWLPATQPGSVSDDIG